MSAYSIPSEILSLSEGDATVKITKDERRPFGSIEIQLNEAGLNRFSGLVDEYGCNSLALSFQHHGETKNDEASHFFTPNLDKISHPENIRALRIGSVGRFARDYDFSMFQRFKNIKSLSVEGIPVVDQVKEFFPSIEVLRIFDWAKNKIRFQAGLWPNLRCLHIVNFRGDLSIFAGWDIQVMFLHYAKIKPFSGLNSFSKLKTFAAERLDSEIDLATLSDLSHLKHLSLRIPRHSAKIAGFASRTLEMLILDKADPADLEQLDIARDLPSLRFYGIDFGRKKALMQWNGFRQYGDPFASVSFIRPYPPE